MGIKILHQAIGTCPFCGSKLTAELAQGTKEKISFRFGSPIMYVGDPRGYNTICLVCGVKWVSSPAWELVDYHDLDDVREEWNDYGDTIQDSFEQEQEEAKKKIGLGPKEKKKKKHGIAGAILRQTLLTPVEKGRGLLSDFGGLTGHVDEKALSQLEAEDEERRRKKEEEDYDDDVDSEENSEEE